MKKLLASLILTFCLCCFSQSYAKQAYVVMADGTVELHNTAAFSVWSPDVDYVAGESAVINSGEQYICISSHTSSAAGGAGNEPGVGASALDKWKPFGSDKFASLSAPTFDQMVTALGYRSNTADGQRMFNTANTIAFSGTPTTGMCQYSTFLSPSGLYCYQDGTWQLQGGDGTASFTKQATDPTAVSPAGFYGNTASGKSYYSDSDGLWDFKLGTLTPWPTPLAAPTAIISGATDQILTFTYPESATANSTADLCDDWSITMAAAGQLNLTYLDGNNGVNPRCTITQPVYSTDTFVSAAYVPGTIKAVDDSGALAAIADFTASLTNSSTEAYGGDSLSDMREFFIVM